MLKNSILIVLFALIGIGGIMIPKQHPVSKDAYLGDKFCQNEICDNSKNAILLFLQENCEYSLGYSHIVPDSKSQLLRFLLLKNNNKSNIIERPLKRNLYFHPYSTLGKTKYYVFALREIIV